MSFVSTGNKPAGNGGPVITTPPITGESGDTSTGSAATGIADAHGRKNPHRFGECQHQQSPGGARGTEYGEMRSPYRRKTHRPGVGKYLH